MPMGDYEDDQIYELYNVLWIRNGDDGIKYRAGCGRVFKHRWEGNSPDLTRVTLG